LKSIQFSPEEDNVQIPFVTKWIEARRERQMEKDFYALEEMDRAKNDAEADAEFERLENERFVETEREYEANVAKYGHYHDETLEVCLGCPEPENYGPPICEEYCGQLGCPECGDEARENLREQQLIFAQ
jgi:hypothetical protein